MILDNRTRYRSADIERVILGALAEAGIDHHGRDRVVVVYSRSASSFTGWCYKGTIRRWNGNARMRLCIPRPIALDFLVDVAQFVWLVRHEVGHWRGLDHAQMGSSLRYWTRGTRRLLGPVGADHPMPAWAEGLAVAVEAAEPSRSGKLRPTADETREKKLAHAGEMLARAERRLKLAETIAKRWRRRLAAAERAVARAAGSGA